MAKTGLVLEGGAMRGLFTAGVMDVLMEQGISFDGLIGVSAGAAFGCNYKSGQIGRVLRYNKRFAHDWRFCSVRSLLTTGDIYGGEFCYHYMPEHLDLFDQQAFNASSMEYVVVCTDIETGEPVYKTLMTYNDEMCEYIRASASMPVAAKIVEIDGRKLLDGGISDSIPLKQFQQMGYKKNIVVTTQPLGYQKQHNRLMPLFRLFLRNYPNMLHVLDTRHIMYNKQLEYVAEQERQGETLVIRPPHALEIGHTCHDIPTMERVYETGRQTATERLNDIKAFLNK
jgi:predicted patatin/cPLA2 family phospholipase